METVFILLVVVLVILAVSDLVVGVSNDAVNFLNSAIGSKAAPFWIIMAVASLGVVFGATFSSGMMEVARKGIFHPEMFSFHNIMIIFLAVMLTDIILLDTFNTLGLPTSTTVSIVFELLGAAVSVAVLKVIHSGEGLNTLGEYINSGKALVIIAGILLSVVVAFSVGTFVQYIVRLVFSFNYEKTYKYWGALWGGIAITAITYFILIKGAKGASFMTDDTKHWIQSNTLVIITVSFTFWTIALKLLQIFTKVNILKMIILVGTFALAMAFAGNDLVNFIGVPLAGLKAYQAWSSGQEMAVLAQKVHTPTLYLLIAGLIMIITLWLSKKARSVTQTSIDLSKQDVGHERFESSPFSRFIVRQSIKLSNALKYITPEPLQKSVSKRFEVPRKENDNDASFDLIRASVNLVVASILISFATSLKLPLSTTYVTFMVAMGTSLADGAWGRESAVYRVNGVITVITGWFFTAFIAFSVAFLVALTIYYIGFIMVPIYLILSVFVLIKSKSVHKQRTEEEDDIFTGNNTKEEINIMEACSINVTKTINQVSEIYGKAVKLIATEDRVGLKKLNKKVEKINERAKALKDGIEATIHELQEDSIETGHYYVQVLDYLREIAHDIAFIVRPAYQHFDNQHSGFNEKQVEELNKLKDLLQDLLDEILDIINNNHFDDIEKALEYQQNILTAINKFRKNQIKRIKDSNASTKNSLLYLGILNETKNMVLHIVNLLKSQRDFIIYQNS
ncbi:MAG: inorganic phosphate transporter [Bacteroidales bacterium]|nr:inorganic phosphate transporter [Bacteroidales bacterium]